MSLNLLSEYDSSSEDGEKSDQKEQNFKEKAPGVRKNFFICDSSSDSPVSSDEASDNEELKSNRKQTVKSPQILPSFSHAIHAIGGESSSSVSVFRNPFLEAERAQTDILQQHVRITEKLEEERGRAKHKFRKSSVPCRQFKRGRCRLGDKCRFLHAAFPSAADSGGLPASETAASQQQQTSYGSKAVRYTEWGAEEVQGDDDDEEPKRKKKRVGVTNSLIPPKKSLANYERQKQTN